MDKRFVSRLQTDLKVSYTVIARIDSTPFEFGNSQLIDLSKKGMAMLVDEPISVPMLLQLQLTLPGQPDSVFLVGKTMYCLPLEELGMYRVGVKFVGLLPPNLEDAIRELHVLRDITTKPGQGSSGSHRDFGVGM